jgi:hypothetical protein
MRPMGWYSVCGFLAASLRREPNPRRKSRAEEVGRGSTPMNADRRLIHTGLLELAMCRSVTLGDGDGVRRPQVSTALLAYKISVHQRSSAANLFGSA